MKSSFCKGKALFQCKLCLLCEIFTGGGRTAQCSSEDIDDFFGRIESFFSCFYQTVFEDAGCFFGFVCFTTVKKLILPAVFNAFRYCSAKSVREESASRAAFA